MGMKYQFDNHNGFGDIVLATAMPRDVKNAFVCLDCGYEFVALKSAKCRRCEARIKKENEHRDKADQIKYLPKVKKKFDWLIRMNTNFPLIWQNNPWLDEFDTEDQTVPIGPGLGTQMSNSSGLHATNNYRISVETALNVSIPQGPPYGDLHLSETERNAPPEIDRRYWLITNGGKEDFTSKLWDYDRWQEVVAALPDITFVQIGLRCHFHPPLRGHNVINMVGQTEDPDEGVRRLLKLFLHCDGSIGSVSAHMHIAGASPFFKPCVVVAGAREPASFERYNWHRYINTGGWLTCPKDPADKRTRGHTAIQTSCWRRSIEACPNKVKCKHNGLEYSIAKCLDLIATADVIRGIQGYYYGGRLAPIEPPDSKRMMTIPREMPLEQAKEISTPLVRPTSRTRRAANAVPVSISHDTDTSGSVSEADGRPLPETYTVEQEPLVLMSPRRTKVFKMLCNAHYWGGGERSSAYIMEMMLNEGYEVHLYPSKYNPQTGSFVIGYEYGLFLESHPEIQVYRKPGDGPGLTDPCDLFCLYANDLVYSFNQPQFSALARLQAHRKVMVLNYRIGKVPELIWTRQWDKYGFLNNTLRSEFIRRYPEARAFALAPPVNIQPFLNTQLQPFISPIHLVKLSSQGDAKHPKDTNLMIQQIRQYHPDAKFSFMPAPSFLDTSVDGVFAYKKNEVPVAEFLAKGNIFWYPLPEGYTDQGPRVLVEAMSLGLPAIADNRDGAAERIKPEETGWLCDNHDEYAEMLKDVTPERLYGMGKAAKKRAERIWKPRFWVAQLTGDGTD